MNGQDARAVLDAAMSEAAFQQALIDAAHALGWRVYHPYDSRRSARGYPDLTMIHREHGLVLAELKTERGRLSAEQRAWLDDLSEARLVHTLVGWRQGYRVYVWRPRDWEQIARVLAGEED